MIRSETSYTSSDTLRELIHDNRLLLMSISRFGIPLKLANKTIAEISAEEGLHAGTFLCITNMISGRPYEASDVDLASLTAYLKRAHVYFLDFFLPVIRRKLVDAIDFGRSSDFAVVVMRFFDDYYDEVRRHMEYENDTLFAYIDRLLTGVRDDGLTIGTFAAHHDAVSHKLNRLKDVLIRYCPEGNSDMLNSALFDIISCEDDLESHCRVEDLILVPAVTAAEAMIPVEEAIEVAGSVQQEDDNTGTVLGKREKEIIACIAKGMSNKEIADALCISVHTVTTHRRNIVAKLEIHSVAGLTVYAILNGLVDIKDI